MTLKTRRQGKSVVPPGRGKKKRDSKRKTKENFLGEKEKKKKKLEK